MEQQQLNIVYGDCINENMTKVYENIFLFLGVTPESNFTYLPDQPTPQDTINFTGNFTSPFGRIVRWEWDFGDGNTSHGETIGLEFDGIDDYISIFNTPSLEIIDTITLEAWFKLNSDPNCDTNNNYRWLITKVGSWSIILEQNRQPTWSVKVDGESYRWFSSTPIWPIEEWVHVAWTYKSKTGEMTAFFNGNNYTNSIGITGDIDTDGNNLQINKPNCAVCPVKGGNFPGSIRDFRIYKRVLTSDEIYQNYISTNDNEIVTSDLVGWWKMNEMGKAAIDIIGNNDATVYGAKWINHAEHKYSNPGTYAVELTVWNEEGLSNSISKNITIS